MTIIIVGCGKAGFLHLNSYKKIISLKNIPLNLFFIDRLKKPKWGNNSATEYKIYDSIDSLIQENYIDKNETIIDLCLPAGTMLTYIKYLKNCGFKNFICEKPFVFYKEKENVKSILKDLNILVVENYKYSKAIEIAKSIIDTNKLLPKIVYAEFNKDRKLDTENGRAFISLKSELPVWEVEIPHLVYVCNYLFGDVDILFKKSEDMIINDRIYKSHKKGVIVGINNDNCVFIMTSNLNSDFKREIKIVFERGYNLQIYFLKNNKTNLMWYHNNKLIKDYSLDEDNMFNMLYDYVSTFLGKKDKKFFNLDEMIKFSNFIKKLTKC